MFKLGLFGSQRLQCSDCWPARCPHMSVRRPPRWPEPARPALTMRSGSAAMPCRMSLAPRRASQETGAASARYAGPPSRAGANTRATAGIGIIDERIIAEKRNAVGWAKAASELGLTHRAGSALAHAVRPPEPLSKDDFSAWAETPARRVLVIQPCKRYCPPYKPCRYRVAPTSTSEIAGT